MGQGPGAIGLLLLSLLAFACTRERATAVATPPVILISIDTLRADHLPMFGYRGVETPHLDALRRDAILYTSAFAQVPLTLPSHATVLTGLDPYRHGVRSNIGFTLDPGTPTIASMLRPAGYVSGAAVSSYVLRGATGIGSGFDFYDDRIERRAGVAIGALERDGSSTAQAATQWIAQSSGRPFFFLLHLFEPHAPYEPAEPFRSRYPLAYDGEIAAADAVVGTFLDDLKKRGLYDDALIIFFSDHGEGLSQHGEPEHGIFLYREAIHVPLVVKLPRNARAGETVAAPVSLADIVPTIAEVTGVKPPSQTDGISLLSENRQPRNIYSETFYPRIHLGWSELRSLAGERFHYIEAPRAELYDMQADPAETTNVLADQRRVFSAIRTELEKVDRAVAAPTHVDPEEAKKLAALGYLSATPATGDGPLPDPKDRIGDIADMARATELARVGRHDESITLLRALLGRNPQFADAWNQLALTLEAAGREREAADAYREAIRQSPSLSGEFALSLGSLLLGLGDLDDAARHAELAAKSNPSGAHLLLARVALARKDSAAAEREARAAGEDATAFAAASVLLAEAASAQGKPAEALTLLDDAARQSEAPIEGLDSARGDALARLERYDEAIAALRRSIEAFPRDRSAYARLAIVHAVQGRPAEARAAIASMLRNVPGPGSQELAARTRRELGL